MVRLRVLDEVSWDGVPVPGERTHALLRALVDSGRRGLSDDALVEEIWAGEAPAHPAKALQVVVSRARTATSATAIERTPTGYRLALETADVDAWSVRPTGLRLAAEGRFAEALPMLERLDADDEVTAAQLRSIAGVHGVPQALEFYEQYRSDLADRLGIDPAPALRDLHAELLRRDRPVRSGLRFDADDLVGRAHDVDQLLRLVHSHRLVSIIGPGGLGKTRLAHLVGRLTDGPVVHFVPLASVTAPDGVAVAVADALGAQGTAATALSRSARNADAVDRIVDMLGSVPALLILDNCEQVVDAVADLVAVVLRRTPRTTVLTTSRSPLALATERVYLLPELAEEDGIALFVERATAARPGVILDPEQVRAVVRRLDGLPLAVELAAAKVRVMGVPEIERRLEDRFALLRGGSRDAPERHQTLQAVIDWSWNLLADPERRALRRLAVFRAGFALEAAEAVIGSDALDRISALVDQSLVVVDENAGGVRYRLLETVREFGLRQLEEHGELEDAENRVADWAADLGDRATARLYTTDQIAMMTEVRAEEGNLAEVVRTSVRADRLGHALRVFAGLVSFWTIEGSHLKVLTLADPVVELVTRREIPAGAEDAARICLSAALSNAVIFGRPAAEGATELLTRLGPGEGATGVRATVRVVLAILASERLNQVEVIRALTDDPDSAVARIACLWTSQALENLGDIDGAREAASRALPLLEPGEGPWMRAMLMSQLAGLELQAGEIGQVRARAAEAHGVLSELGADDDAAQVLAMSALVALREGQLDEADAILDEVGASDHGANVFGAGIALLCGRAEVLLARGDIDAGIASYEEAIDRLSTGGVPTFDWADGFEPWALLPQSGALAAAARHDRLAGRAPRRQALIERARTLLTIEEAWVDVPILGCSLAALGFWAARAGDPDRAAHLLALAEALSLNRMLPSLDPSYGDPLVDPVTVGAVRATYASRNADELRATALAVVTELV